MTKTQTAWHRANKTKQIKGFKMKQITIKSYEKMFNKLTTEWLKGIDWRVVEFTENEIAQAGDDFQSDAYSELGGDAIEICDWELYDESCDIRGDFEINLSELWEKALKRRANKQTNNKDLK